MGIIENAKDALKLVQKIDNIELYGKILDLQSEAFELIEQSKLKDEKIAKLKKALKVKGKMVCKDSAYYLTDDKGKIIDGPFCTKCFDADQDSIRIVAHTIHAQVKCLKCKVIFDSENIYNNLVPRELFPKDDDRGVQDLLAID
ncbi:MAG: hypothetical protein ACYTBX_06905 [Planctomycetota bacterium]|jgi:hypothetical protein